MMHETPWWRLNIASVPLNLPPYKASCFTALEYFWVIYKPIVWTKSYPSRAKILQNVARHLPSCQSGRVSLTAMHIRFLKLDKKWALQLNNTRKLHGNPIWYEILFLLLFSSYACVCERACPYVCKCMCVLRHFSPELSFTFGRQDALLATWRNDFFKKRRVRGSAGRQRAGEGPGRPKNNTPRYNAKVVMRYCNDTGWQFSRHPHRQSTSTPALCRAVAEPVLVPRAWAPRGPTCRGPVTNTATKVSGVMWIQYLRQNSSRHRNGQPRNRLDLVVNDADYSSACLW